MQTNGAADVQRSSMRRVAAGMLVAAAAYFLIVALAAAQTATLTLCGEKIEYKPVGSASTPGKQLVGVWVGEVTGMLPAYGVDYMRCIAFAIEDVQPDGAVVAKVALAGTRNVPRYPFANQVKPLVATLNGKLGDNNRTLRFVSKSGDETLVLQVSGSKKMEGTGTSKTNGDSRVSLTRQ